jgi:hypothetical protein
MKKFFKKICSDYVDILLIIGIIICFLLLLLTCNGCANIRPEYDSNGNIIGASSYGFLRTIRVEQHKADGTQLILETKSNTGDVLSGVNQILGTGLGAVRDLMPY